MRPEAALSPVARIVLAIAIGVATMLVPSCGDSGGAGVQAGGPVNRADWIDWTAPALP